MLSGIDLGHHLIKAKPSCSNWVTISLAPQSPQNHSKTNFKMESISVKLLAVKAVPNRMFVYGQLQFLLEF